MARWILAALVAIVLGGCDLFDDDDSSDASPQPPPEEEPAPNTQEIETNLTAGQVIDGGQMGASGTADLILNLDDNLLSGTVVLEGVSADSVVLNTGYAGESGSQFATLDQQGGDWTLPETEFSAQERERLMAGGFHIIATSADDRVLRGQILVGTVELLLTRLSGMQVVPPVDTMATGRGFLTVDTSSGDIVVNLRLQGLDDATQAHIHRALAGVNGGVIEDLVQGDAGPGHWTSEQEATLAAEELEALNAGALYYQVHTTEWPGGEVRGQLEPAGVEIDFTLLAGEDVVIPGMSGVDTDASATAVTTLVTNDGLLDIHLNTRNLDDATGASLNVAPEGQNGPVREALEQEEGNAGHWFAEGVMLDDEDRENLRNQAFYFTVTSPEWPDGEIRGQWRPEGSSPGGDDETFQVVAVEPDDGAELEQFPAQIQVTFNREPDGGSANPESVELTASGGDGSFEDGNEEAMTRKRPLRCRFAPMTPATSSGASPSPSQANGTTATGSAPVTPRVISMRNTSACASGASMDSNIPATSLRTSFDLLVFN